MNKIIKDIFYYYLGDNAFDRKQLIRAYVGVFILTLLGIKGVIR